MESLRLKVHYDILTRTLNIKEVRKKMKKLILNFDAGLVNEAITANIILENQVIINILRANVSEQGGIFLIEVPDERCELVRTAFEEAGVKVEHGKNH